MHAIPRILVFVSTAVAASAQAATGDGIGAVVQNSLSVATNYVAGISLGLASIYGVLLWIDQTLIGGKTDRMVAFAIGFTMIALSSGIVALILSSGSGS